MKWYSFETESKIKNSITEKSCVLCLCDYIISLQKFQFVDLRQENNFGYIFVTRWVLFEDKIVE